jgi:surface polysaccharide O-acyltransferase-like enzyme
VQSVQNVSATKTERNYGIDLLRIVSMLMIVVLHLMGHGNILKSTVVLSRQYEVAWFLETASYCAVNCYAIISGYVGIKSKFKYSNIIYLWLQVAFYSVLISSITYITLQNIRKSEIIDAFFPVSNNIYWYFTAYFCIYFFTPLFNKGVNALSERQLKAIGVAIFILFCIVPIFAEKDVFLFNGGYSPIWLIMLYVFGGILSKCNILSKLKPWALMLLYLLMVVITWAERFVCDYYNTHFSQAEPLKINLTSYLSPTIFLAAVFLCLGFSKLKISKTSSKIIKILAPASFGVYLIHDNPYVRNLVVKKIASNFLKLGALELGVAVVTTVIVIYLVCSVIDILREKIFKILKIKKILQTLENRFLRNIW